MTNALPRRPISLPILRGPLSAGPGHRFYLIFLSVSFAAALSCSSRAKGYFLPFSFISFFSLPSFLRVLHCEEEAEGRQTAGQPLVMVQHELNGPGSSSSCWPRSRKIFCQPLGLFGFPGGVVRRRLNSNVSKKHLKCLLIIAGRCPVAIIFWLFRREQYKRLGLFEHANLRCTSDKYLLSLLKTTQSLHS